MLESIELSVETHGPVAVPEQADDVQRLLEPADRSVEVEAVGLDVLGLTATQTEDEPALGQMVDRQRGLRQRRRMAAHGVDDAGDQWHVLGEHGRSGRDGHAVEVAMR